MTSSVRRAINGLVKPFYAQVPPSYRRLFISFFLLLLVVTVGALSFFMLGEGRWSLFDCLYMTVITISTVGFAETLQDMALVHEARVLTMSLIISGTGTLLYFISSLTALIIEGDLGGMIRRRKMTAAIETLRGHYIVCGTGTTGRHIVEELLAGGADFIAIEQNADRLTELEQELGIELLYVHGDATEDIVLQRAGIDRAKGVISALNDDKANLFVTISARALNPTARIVSKAIEPTTEIKLRHAGADAVVSPNYIGGVRLVSEMVRPKAMALLDRLIRDHKGAPIGLDSVNVPADSVLVGKSLAQASFREPRTLVIAIHQPDGEYIYNPGGEHRLEAGASLFVLADPIGLSQLRKRLDETA